MIKYDDNGNITLATLEIEPSSKIERDMLKKFAGMTPKQRANLIEIGFEKMTRYHQSEADRVSGN